METESILNTELEFDVKQVAKDILQTIEKEREREIVSRRFGLYGPKETLEQIGNYLGITRERVRQIEKQVITKLSTISIPYIKRANDHFKLQLEELGRVAPLEELAAKLGATGKEGHSHVNFLATLAPDLEVVDENDHFRHSVAIREHHDHKLLKVLLDELIETVKGIGEPAELDHIHSQMRTKLEKHHLHGLARSAKRITNLDQKWGLNSWPLVNPRSIRDKIYVILKKKGEPMHFGDIASAIQSSGFKRSNVTTQAIHNELIKDKRFVLVGRGIYALKEWGYTEGTVADVIERILEKEAPLHRDEIVQRVLKQRQVKPTTIILNLQGKPQFKRVAKATYSLTD